MNAPIPAILLLLLTALVSGCSMALSAEDALPADPMPRTMALASIKDDLSGMAQPAERPVAVAVVRPLITGLGMAQVSRQPGGSLNEKRLLAIRAARLDAIRDLTEQVYGIQLSSVTSVRDTVVQNDQIKALVAGEIRGARTERITPKGSDSYEVVLSLDSDVVAYIMRAAALGV